jgi:hydrogenase nickel incorporation protein HypA/HybF
VTLHEYSIIHALVASVRAHVDGVAGDPRPVVKVVRIEIGTLAGVDVELLATAFEVFRETTICETAILEIRSVEAQWACPRCDAIVARGAVLRCTACALPASLTRGDEIVLCQIELAIDEQPDLLQPRSSEGETDHVPGQEW